MNKDELMEMAREVGVSTSCWQIWPPTFKRQIDFTPEQLASFTNAILERAAAEFPQPYVEIDGAEIQAVIRALKINTGD